MVTSKDIRPSAQRMPFTSSGELKPEGPGPLPEGYQFAPDIEGLPWVRKEGDEWTTAEFRRIVFDWLISFFAARDWPIAWEVIEKARAERSVNRLDEDKLYLVIAILRKDDKKRYEVAVVFRKNQREENPEAARIILADAEQAIDAQYASG
jgi:hypothetical protein